MTRFDIMMGKTNEKKELIKLTLILEENDDILKSIEIGMKEHKIKSAEIIEIHGELLTGIINSLEEGKKEINEIELIKATGKFKFGGDDLWGKMNIFTGTKKPLSGQLLRGRAKEGLKIILEY